ncbi:hypothetical protein EKO24_021610 [Candidatus Methylobacter oryzae]|uniref:NERD domain-containing protein n=2 Tax=Candidatus Methylobacter oryzae TaxID=2497749 RepID=A0ABY3C5J3_9GAMM|nr:hypothetical protein EKO24_021610 [Candidatus Methylobacter oryzae]
MFDNPFDHLTDDQRKDLIRGISETHKKGFYESLNIIQDLLKTHDPINLLAIISGYGLSVGAGDAGVQSNEGHALITQSHAEMLQALFLQIPKHDWGTNPVTPNVVQKGFDTLAELGRAFSFSHMDSGRLDASAKDKAIDSIQFLVRSNTQTVRNWGYYSQVFNISTELYSYFDEILLDKLGFSATNIIETFNSMLRTMENSLTERHVILSKLKAIKKPKELILKYHELIGQGQEEADQFYKVNGISKLSIKSLFLMLWGHYDLRMSDSFYFTVEAVSSKTGIDSEITKLVLDYFSYSPGDLETHKTEFLFLDNPVWNKPIIKDEKAYFCPMPQLFFSFVLSSLDELIEKIDKDKLHDRRANYLEEKIEEIVKRRFPEALTVSCVKWRVAERQFETDLITFIDSHAIIIEAKAHKISKSALRGAPDRIKRHIKEILVEPSVQSKRLENRLNELRLDATISDELRDKLPVDLSGIHKVLRVSVSLEDFASLQANFSRFVDTEWLPEDFYPCPTMNLADFETLFDFLEHPVQIIHYLQRRTELERHVSFLGDELDFMGLYEMTLFNLGSMQSENRTEIIITEMSAPLDKYYRSRDEGIIIEKPRPKISKLFNDIFRKLEERSTPQWTEIGVLLNMFSPNDQLKLASAVEVLKKGVNRTWQMEGHKNAIIYVPPDASEYALAYVLFKNGNAHRRYEFIENAAASGLEPAHVKSCLVIAKNIDQDDRPYHYISLCKSSDD